MKAASSLGLALAWSCGICWASAALPTQNAPHDPHPRGIAEKAPPPQTSGHLERPDDPPAAKPAIPPEQTRSRSGPWVRGPYVSIQVNVDAQGLNIPYDAANEPSLAIDPTDPNKMVIGWRQFDTVESNFRQAGWAYSHDGGQTWTFPGVLEPGVFRSDPVLGADSQGTFYYNSLTAAGNNYWCNVFRSYDGGVTWDYGPFAQGGDKQWMAIDRTGGIGDGNIYAYWTLYWSICDGHFTRSCDGGDTYPVCLDVPGNPFWGTLAVGPDGELYLAGDGYVVAKSSTMQDESEPPAWDFATVADLDGSMAFSGGPNPGGLLGQVGIAVDHSAGPARGNVYLLCSVTRHSIPDPLDVMFSRSTDGGLTWSHPLRVNDDPQDNGAYQWFGAMSVAPSGRIDAIWNDTRASPLGFYSEVYYSYSTDAGRTWARNVPVSPSFGHFVGYPNQNKLGDYYEIISDDQGASLAYAATFNGEQDVYFIHLFPDCNENGVHDATDIAGPTSDDCGGNDMPDECEPDCNGNQVADSCDIFSGTSDDCNGNLIPDECDPDEDCNANGIQDICDVAGGTSSDCDGNDVPDECDLDCDNNGTPDACQPPLGSMMLLRNNSSRIGAVVGPQGAPLAQDVHLDGPAALRRFTVSYQAVGSTSPATLTVRFFNGSVDDSLLPDYPAGLLAEYVNFELVRWSPYEERWDYSLSEPLGLPADLWMEIDFDPAPGYGSLGPGDYGVLHQADPPTTGTSHGLVYDRLNGTTTSPLYLDLSLFGALCADCNNNRIHDPCDLDCDAPGGRCAVPGCGSGDDCNYNRQPDDCDIAEGTSQDDNQNGVPDECDCVCGDADRSGGKIDLEDFAVFAFCYGLSAPSPDCSAADLYCCDLNGSGKVNLLDFAIFALLYGTTPSGLVPDCLE